MQGGGGRVAAVAFEHHRRSDLEPLAQPLQQGEHGRRDGIGVRVVVDARVRGVLGTTGDVHVRHPLQRDRVEQRLRVRAAVQRVRVHVGDVEQQHRAGALEQGGEELALGVLVVRPVEQRRDRLQRERDVQLGLDLAHVRGQDVQRGAAAGQRQQVPGFPATRAHERDVLAHQRRIERRGAGGEVGDPHGVERLRTPQGEPHPVRDRRHPAPP